MTSAPPPDRRIYVTGGRQRKLLFKDEDESHLYETALILEVNPEDGSARICVEYQSPSEVRANERASVLFKSGTLRGGKLYICTSTEVLIFEVPSFRRIGYVSLPCFNDLHHVTPARDGSLLAVSTGLDMVIKFNQSGTMLQEWNVLGKDPWARFSRAVDYRKIATTKPHRSHPNFVFELGEEIWVTRFVQRDAVCLTTWGKRIELPGEAPHDGVILGNKIFFTSVDGRILIADRETLQVSRSIDLNEVGSEKKILLGWCRSLLSLNDQLLWAGFTRVRKTAFRENLLWVKHRFQETEKPTHIALYDLSEGRRLHEVDLERYGMNVVFGIYPAK